MRSEAKADFDQILNILKVRPDKKQFHGLGIKNRNNTAKQERRFQRFWAIRKKPTHPRIFILHKPLRVRVSSTRLLWEKKAAIFVLFAVLGLEEIDSESHRNPRVFGFFFSRVLYGRYRIGEPVDRAFLRFVR